MYVELEDSVQVLEPIVRISDIASVYVADEAILSKIKNTVLYEFQKGKGSRGEKQVISLLWLTKAIQSQFPECVVILHGESDCVVELVDPDRKKGKKKGLQHLKVVLVSLICLFGGAFSIMAFHNDIDITSIFGQFYEMVTGRPSSGFTILEISYSLGLLVGILVFYNHVGKKKIVPEPTPIEVSMRNYERDMDEAIVKRWEREGRTVDVD